MNDEKNLTTATLNEHAEPKEHEIRVEKVKQMRAAHLEPWPSFEPVTTTTEQALVDFQKTSDETKQLSLAGRLMIIRDHGKTFFARLQDRSGQIQLYIKKDIIGDQSFEHFCKDIDLGDIVWVTGTLFNTKTGEVTMRVETFKLLSKCLHPLPEKYHGLVDVEHRYRQRYLDLMCNQDSREKFKKRSGIVQAIRRFLQDQDFMEVETPMLHPIPGGAAARPFVTHHNAYDMQLFLRIAPELYLKQLVVGGFERVFEINRNFRNEGVSTKHNPEFTMLEFYMAHGDYHTGMTLTEKLIQHAVLQNFDSLIIDYQGNKLDFTAPFRRLSIKDSLIEIGGLKPEQITEENIDQTIKELNVHVPGKPNYGMKIFGLFEECVEAKIVQPTFIISYPLEVSPLAKRDSQDPTIAARFELFAMSMELSNGFTELNDPFDQAERFRAQVQARTDGDSEAHHYDADFIKALEYGLPPTVGVGIGIDRLVMLLTNTNSIKDVILFPTMKKAAHKE